MFNGTADKSKYVEIIRGRHIIIERTEDGPVHLDGEPQIMGQDINIMVMPGALRIITGKTFNGEYPIAPYGEHKPAVNQ
jgi:diacylglycerol kinase family enzyme